MVLGKNEKEIYGIYLIKGITSKMYKNLYNSVAKKQSKAKQNKTKHTA